MRLRMVEEAYKLSTSVWGMPPDVFWSLHPLEWWWQFDARRPVKLIGGLGEEVAEELWQIAMK